MAMAEEIYDVDCPVSLEVLPGSGFTSEEKMAMTLDDATLRQVLKVVEILGQMGEDRLENLVRLSRSLADTGNISRLPDIAVNVSDLAAISSLGKDFWVKAQNGEHKALPRLQMGVEYNRPSQTKTLYNLQPCMAYVRFGNDAARYRRFIESWKESQGY